MFEPRPAPKRWHEPVRIALAVVWVITLTLWVYIQVVSLCSGMDRYQTALDGASMTMLTANTLWFASFFPALAFGLAWYVFTLHMRRAPSRAPLNCGIHRLATAQTYMTLCIGISLFLFNWRLLPLKQIVTSGWERISEPLIGFHWGDQPLWGGPPALEHQALVGALGAAVVFLRAWGLVPQLGGRRRNLLAMTVVLLSVGLLVPPTDMLYALPSPIPESIRNLDRGDPVVRGLLLGDPVHREAARDKLARYFETFDDEGKIGTLQGIHRSWLSHWPRTDDPYESNRLLCGLCQLPGVYAWTMNGLSLALNGDNDPSADPPSIVVEVPRRATEARVYEPLKPGAVLTVPMSQLPTLVRAREPLVLKIDWMVEMQVVLDLLNSLRDEDVPRVDLAVIPYGHVALPEILPRLRIDAPERGEIYQPRHPPSERRIIVVKKYIPPDGRPPPSPRCKDLYWLDEYEDAWKRVYVEPPGSLPTSVTIEVEVNEPYGEFIGVLQGAIVGGAREINLVTAATPDQADH